MYLTKLYVSIKNIHQVDGLLTYPVSSYKEVTHYIEECNKNRTVAVTKMNENSRSV